MIDITSITGASCNLLKFHTVFKICFYDKKKNLIMFLKAKKVNFRITLLFENNIHKISLNTTRLYVELLIVDFHFNKVLFFSV